MKATAIDPAYYNRRPVKPLRYPNAANRALTLEKIVDYLLAVAIGVGVVTVFLFLLTLG